MTKSLKQMELWRRLAVGLFYEDRKQVTLMRGYDWENAALDMKLEYQRRAKEMLADVLKEAKATK